jgi:hypothetical protein
VTGRAAGQGALAGAAAPRAGSSRLARGRGVAALATCVALGVFVAAMAVAIAAYPGGSWTQADASGFSLARNFWCDLLRSQGINGADNATAKLWASIAFGALGFALWPYWWVAGSLLSGRARRLVTRLGTASAACLAAMTLFPSDSHRIAHGVVALAGALLGMLAAAASVAVRAPGEARFSLRRSSGALALLLAACNALLYIQVAYLGGPETVAQPIVQKLATLMLLAWMFSTVQHARTPPRSVALERAVER